MTWHKRPLLEAFEDLGYRDAYKSASSINTLISGGTEYSDYKSALEGMGTGLYKKFGMPADEKVLETQRKSFGRNELSEVDLNPW
jgi:hypothetical protein